MHPIHLGVNIDHVATVRQARGTSYPDPVYAALVAEQHGADSITVHLREDRRHIQERDVQLLRTTLQTRMNLEMAATPDMVQYALALQPQDCCLVPEHRQELTTEGGLDVLSAGPALQASCERLTAAGIRVAIFADPEPQQLAALAQLQVPVVELHTGTYAQACGAAQAREWSRLQQAAQYAASLGLTVHAGHGLHYHNVQAIAEIPEIVELNIGHAIVARALFTGFAAAVREMKNLLQTARVT